jgi:hypothetical protein
MEVEGARGYEYKELKQSESEERAGVERSTEESYEKI